MGELQPIRTATPSDAEAIKAVAVAAKMFSAEEVAFFDEPLGGFFDGSMEGHRWLVQQRDGVEGVVASAYYAPEPFSDRMWNLYFIAVDPAEQGQGTGRALLRHVEAELLALGEERARTLIVETSSTEAYAATREFYRRNGFDEQATIREFYGPQDHKVVFWKRLTAG